MTWINLLAAIKGVRSSWANGAKELVTGVLKFCQTLVGVGQFFSLQAQVFDDHFVILTQPAAETSRTIAREMLLLLSSIWLKASLSISKTVV